MKAAIAKAITAKAEAASVDATEAKNPGHGGRYGRDRGRDCDCEECTEMAGREIFLCNEVKSGEVCNCHRAYHEMMFDYGSKK